MAPATQVNSPIAAIGILPAGASPGDKAQNVVGCIAIMQSTGNWQITTNDSTIAPGNSVIMFGPGSGSNIAKGVNFGQPAQVGNVFLTQIYRTDTGAAVDFDMQFVIWRLPAQK